MEIKVTYQGVEKAVIDFQAYSTIEQMRRLGYCSFRMRSKVSKYEPFASFINEDTEERIYFYPDKSFSKMNDTKVSLEELCVIKEIIEYNYSISYHANEEESEVE